jgi:hypothetical protein
MVGLCDRQAGGAEHARNQRLCHTKVQVGQVQEAGGLYLAAWAIRAQIFSGSPSAGSCSNELAFWGHGETQTP